MLHLVLPEAPLLPSIYHGRQYCTVKVAEDM